ncbi:PhzF family phenazine biosynthesis protein [Aporhodopirellula aestuarii]|uniref:PhzF family phenazine biosynthesis protein n=1 Tax=Aporhodopirellula aestuarii TaxID=2950107 RepID=A0ABT0U071_9BACT|nr:PhzF family phenazine biosynthesis protein [Aporhodopirellula aestuarii]MCM2370273.1 PhzF family phenazine biosynthesis protein [Aporhodopirellula aestuarii]
MSIPIWQVDAFANAPFTGNPAAVCLLDKYPGDAWMQSVAAEMNLAETSFVVPLQRQGEFHLRWFTPAVEVDLCGHATLAAAHTLIEQRRVAPGEAIRFQTRSGMLVCQQNDHVITLDFPSTPIIETVAVPLANEVRQSLGVDRATVLRSKFDLVAVVDNASTVRSVTPDFNRLGKIDTRAVMITARSDTPDVDFISRVFAPRVGINEDPVTGSAYCCLAPYWGELLDKTSLVAYQASKRGGTVSCQIAGDRVEISGTAVTVMKATLLVYPE